MKILRAIISVATETFWDALCVWIILVLGGQTVATSFILGLSLDDAFVLATFTLETFMVVWAFCHGIAVMVKEVIRRYKSE